MSLLSTLRLRPATFRCLTLLLITLVASAAQAQPTYRCQQGGRVLLSDKPCPNSGPGMAAYGPVQQPPAAPRHPTWAATQAPTRAAEHLGYLSPRCAELNEAIRTGPSRGVGHQTLSELRDHYRRECQDDDTEARRGLHQQEQAQRQQRKAQREADQRAQVEREQTSAQCSELKRILANKQQRWATLTDGERGDLERGRAAYLQRCGAG